MTEDVLFARLRKFVVDNFLEMKGNEIAAAEKRRGQSFDRGHVT